MRQIRENFYGADLTEQEQVMLEYVGKMTLDSQHMSAEDMQRLRDAGFAEEQILEIVQLAAWFNYMTRVADALGVEVEEPRHAWRDYLLREPGPPPTPPWQGGGESVLAERRQDQRQA